MNAEQLFPYQQENETEMESIRRLADVLEVRFDEIVRSGSQGTSVGIQSRNVLLSRRTDSHTFFVQDSRFGSEGEFAPMDLPDDRYMKFAEGILKKLDIPDSEIAGSSVISEQTQAGEFNRQTGETKMEDVRQGKRYVLVNRQIEKLPVWSSRVLLGLMAKGRIGFLEAHWPEIPKVTVAEAHSLAQRVKEGWRAPERHGARVEDVQAGIIHSPAVGFVMDIYPVIRVIYAPTDETFSKRVVVYLDRFGRPVPTPRQFDLPPEKPPETRGEQGGGISDRLRTHFRALLLSNAKELEALKQNTFYEDLGCVGLQPQFNKLEAVVYINRHSGYGGDLCSTGSREYVRFYLSYDNGATWEDQGITSFNVWDLPFEGDRLEYAVSLDIHPSEKFCLTENLPLARAILSWNVPPPAKTPDYPPYWGKVVDAHVQIRSLQFPIWSQVLAEAKLELPGELKPLLDLDQPTALKVPALSVAELVDQYQGKAVPAHRFLSPHLHQWVANSEILPSITLNIDWAKVIEAWLATQQAVQFEELKCIGLDPNSDQLLGVIDLKLSSGYSGGLCTAGSLEYVAFWIDYGAGWSYAGTTSVNVHDITNIPPDGLQYAVNLPVNFDGHRNPCNQGVVTAKVRAILSWNTPPPPGNPDYIPTWGNRLHTLIHIQPGPVVEGHSPYLSSLGDIGESHINSSGLATGSTIHTGLPLSSSPFGGRVTIAGHIAFPTSGLKYRVMKKLHSAPVTAFAPLSFDPLTLLINTWNSGTGWSQSYVTVNPDINGYYPFEDYAWYHNVEGSIMGVWYTGAAEDGNTYDLRIDVDTDGNPAHDLHSNVVTALIDNKAPDVSLTINLGGGVQCGNFTPGSTFTGAYSAIDPHFGGFSFEIEPSGPPSYPSHNVLPVPPSGVSAFLGGAIAAPGVSGGSYTINTGYTAGPPPAGPMDPCGYALILHAYDRTNVNSGGGYNRSIASVGFCLSTP
jgi:hypothetical protein